MTVTLTEGEIKRAIQHYMASKTRMTLWQDFDVSLHWRGKAPYATVVVLKPAPVLTDTVSYGGSS